MRSSPGHSRRNRAEPSLDRPATGAPAVARHHACSWLEVRQRLASGRRPAIDKDVPPSNGLQIQDAMLVPGVGAKPVLHLCIRSSADDQYRATFVRQRTTEQDEVFGDQCVDELGVLIPVGLLTRAFSKIAVRAGG